MLNSSSSSFDIIVYYFCSVLKPQCLGQADRQNKALSVLIVDITATEYRPSIVEYKRKCDVSSVYVV